MINTKTQHTTINLNEFVELSKQKLGTMFTELNNNIYFVEVRPMTNRYADITPIGNHRYRIRINKNWLNQNPPIEHLQNTIFHELLHSCNGCMNHGPRWKAYAQKVNIKWGTNISRTSLYEEYTYQKPKVNYEIFCPTCNKVIAKRNRLSKAIANGNVRRAKCKCDNLKIIRK